MNGNAAAIPPRIPIGKAGPTATTLGTAAGGSCKGVEDLELLKTIGTGTFARVYLCRHRRNNNSGGYAALKILGKHDVIRLKQVEHVKNERQILSDIKVCLLPILWPKSAQNTTISTSRKKDLRPTWGSNPRP